MKRLLLFAFLLIGIGFSSRAAVGDTTVVYAQSNVDMGDHPIDLDSLIYLPDGSKTYRKILMVFTLGKYACAGGATYCGQWDYTVDNYFMKDNGDTIHLGRFITPFAYSGYGPFSNNWKGDYIFDVTDYYSVLKDSGRVRISYSGWSGGYTASVKFIYIEGTPARNVTGFDRLWHGYFQYGGAAPIDNVITGQSKTVPANTQSAELKFTVSGHGADNNNCSEFCKKYYQVKLNGSQIVQKDIWRDNCGFNQLYPGNGTWIYDRGNWCPGDLVNTNTHVLSGLSAGNNYSIDVDFENYTDNGKAGYGVDAAVIYYAGFNHSIDASIEYIIAPNNNAMFARNNPVGDYPRVVAKNNGSSAITSIKFEYSVSGGQAREYTWQGSLASLDTTTVVLPEVPELRTATGTNLMFAANIKEVNGSADEDISNNKSISYFNAAPQWPMQFIVKLLTNAGDVGNGVSETSWKILDATDNVIAKRENCVLNKQYNDTVSVGPGSYRLVVTDAGCDGLSYAPYSYPGVPYNPGRGNLSVRSMGSIIPFVLNGYYSGDFGCGYTQWFDVIWPTEVVNVNAQNAAMEVYPNPATNMVNISFTGMSQVKGTVKILDAVGRVVVNMPCSSYNTQINTANLTNGVYSVIFVGNDGGDKMHTRLVINK